MPKSERVIASGAKLQQENQKLRDENASLKKKLNGHPKRHPIRQTIVWLCVALAAALLVVGNIFFWLGNTVVDTHKFVSTVGPVIQKPSVQSGLASYTTNQIFLNYDVESTVRSVLPPRADFLAPQLTSQLKSGVQGTIQKILASSKFQQTWTQVLQKNHDRLVTFAKSYKGNGTITFNDVYAQLSKQLADTKLSFLANKQLPAKVTSVQITTVGWLPALHNLSTNIGLYQALATFLLLLLSAAAIWLAGRKRRMVITLAILFAVMMVISLLAIRITKGLVVSRTNPMYQSAMSDITNIVFHPLVLQTYALLLASMLIGIIAWLSGPYKSAELFRDRVEALLAGKLHQSVFGTHENSITRFVGRYKRQLQWISVSVVAIIMLIVTLTPKAVILYALLILLLVFLVEFLAAQS